MENINNSGHVLTLVQVINEDFSDLGCEDAFFTVTHMHIENEEPSESLFYKYIDYFYGLFHERCLYLDFVIQRMMTYGLQYDKVIETKRLIHFLRTFKNHTLDASKAHDLSIIKFVNQWCYINSDRKDDNKWDYTSLSLVLCSNVCEALETIHVCVEKMKDDEKRSDLVISLKTIKDGYWSDHEIEDICANHFEKLSIPIDPHSFTKQYSSRIRDKLKQLRIADKQDCINEMILCIEQYMFSDDLCICPLSATRIQNAFGLEPGKELGDLKRKALEIYKENVFASEQELLERLIELFPEKVVT